MVGCNSNDGVGDQNPIAIETFDITITGLPESLVSIMGIAVSQQFQVSVKTSDGLLANDVTLALSMYSGSGSIEPSRTQTNEYGFVVATYTVNPEEGQEFVTIEARVLSSTATEQVRVVGLPRPSSLVLTTPTPEVIANNVDQVHIPITATLADAQGNATAGLDVEFELIPFNDGGATFGSLSAPALTDLDGSSVVIFRSLGQFGKQKVVCRIINGGGELDDISDTLTIDVKSLDDTIGFFLMSITPDFLLVSIAEAETAWVDIQIRDANNRALVGIPTAVTAEIGRISGNAVSDSSGQVRLTYIIRHGELPPAIITIPLLATIPGTAWQYRRDITLSPEDPGEPSFVLVASPSVIWADNGQTTVTLTAILKDSNGEGIADRSVTFGSAIGIAESPVLTDNRGSATSVFSDDGRPSIDENGATDSLLITARVRSMNLESSVNIVIYPYDPVRAIILDLQADEVVAGNQDSTVFTITCNGVNGLPVGEQQSVRLSAGIGRVFPILVNTVNGIAESAYYPPFSTGVDTITALVDNGNGDVVTERVLVTILPGPTEYGTSTIEPRELFIGDPNASAQLEVQLFDQFNNRVGEGIQLNYTASLGSVTQSSVTDQNGVATATIRPGVRIGVALITITLDGAEQNLGVATVTFSDSPPFAIEMEAESLRLHAAGTGDTTSTGVYVTVINEFGSPVVNPVRVTFEIIDESAPPEGCAFHTGDQFFIDNTDEEGVAFVTVESGTAIGAKLVRAYTWTDAEHQDTIFVELEGLEVIPGAPYSLQLGYNPHGADAGGGSWTIDVWADVRDILRNRVSDRTRVFFSLDGEVGNIQNGETVDGIVTVPLLYNGAATFEQIVVTGRVRIGEQVVSDDISFQLPLQGGAIDANVAPGNWSFEEGREVAQIAISIELRDGHRTLINNGLIRITPELGDIYWLDIETDELVRFFGGRGQILTGLNDDNHEAEPGSVIVYLIAEEDDIFDDPFVAQMVVPIDIVLDDYEDDVSTQVEVTFTRQIDQASSR